jgi:hypothetical protein
VGFFDDRKAALDQGDDENDEGDGDLDLEEPRAAYLGGVVPIEAVLAQSETGAIAVRGIVAYPDGFELQVVLWARPPSHGARRQRRGMWGAIAVDRSDLDGRDPLPPDFVRFGIQFPDGTSVTNLDPPPWELSPDADQPSHGMESHGGSGSDRYFEQGWWVWPVPGPGALSLICEWPSHDIGETRYEIEADLIRQAAERARPVWPDRTGPSHLTSAQLMSHFTTRRRTDPE